MKVHHNTAVKVPCGKQNEKTLGIQEHAAASHKSAAKSFCKVSSGGEREKIRVREIGRE